MTDDLRVVIGAREIYDRLGEVIAKWDSRWTEQAVINAKLESRVVVLEEDRRDKARTSTKVVDRAWLLWTTLILAAAALISAFLPIHAAH